MYPIPIVSWQKTTLGHELRKDVKSKNIVFRVFSIRVNTRLKEFIRTGVAKFSLTLSKFSITENIMLN